MKGEPKIPKGYRRLRVGTVRREGDRLWCRNGWFATAWIGVPLGTRELIYIRKIKRRGRVRK